MKKYLVLFGIVALMFSCNPQKDNIPEVVKAKFQSDYPTIQDVEWEIEGEYFEAEAEIDGIMTSILYDAHGNVIQKEVECNIDELPSGVMIYLSQNYAGQKIMEVEKIESTEKGIQYEVEIKIDVKEMEIYFDENGNFVEAITEDEAEDDEIGDTEEGLNYEIPAGMQQEALIQLAELPERIQSYLAENYAEANITEFSIEKDGDLEVYEVEITSVDGTETELIFDMDGNFKGIDE